MAKLPHDTTDYGVRNKKISERVSIIGRDSPTNLLANTVKESLKKTIYKDGASGDAVVVKALDTAMSNFYNTNPVLKNADKAKEHQLYRCVVVNDPSCQGMPMIEGPEDNVADLPGSTMVFTVAPNVSVASGNLVRVRFNNRNTSHLTIAGKIEKLLDAGQNWKLLSGWCDPSAPKGKGKTAPGTQSTTVLRCAPAPKKSKVPIVPARRPPAGAKNLVLPTNPISSKTIKTAADLPVFTSRFGTRKAPTPGASSQHGGIDLVAPLGDKIYAALDGIVAAKAQDGTGAVGYGWYVVIKHVAYKSTTPDNIFYTLYGHLDPAVLKTFPTSFKAGQKIKAGALLGRSWNTGTTTGPHLHFSLIWDHKSGWEPGQVAEFGAIADPWSDFFNNKFEKL